VGPFLLAVPKRCLGSAQDFKLLFPDAMIVTPAPIWAHNDLGTIFYGRCSFKRPNIKVRRAFLTN